MCEKEQLHYVETEIYMLCYCNWVKRFQTQESLKWCTCHVTMNKAPLITQVRACFSSNYYARDFTDLRHSSSTSDAGSMPRLPSVLPAVDHSIWIFSSLLPRAIHCAVYRSIAYRGQPSYQVCDQPCNQSLSIKRFFQSDFAFLPVTCMNRTNRSAIAFSPACEQALLS